MKHRTSLLSRARLPAFLAAYGVLAFILMICVAIEAVLQGPDLGLWGSPRWRGLVYQNGGFWRGLLDNW